MSKKRKIEGKQEREDKCHIKQRLMFVISNNVNQQLKYILQLKLD